MHLQTRLTRLLGIALPVLCGVGNDPEAARTVAAAGGFPVIDGGSHLAETMAILSESGTAFAVDLLASSPDNCSVTIPDRVPMLLRESEGWPAGAFCVLQVVDAAGARRAVEAGARALVLYRPAAGPTGTASIEAVSRAAPTLPLLVAPDPDDSLTLSAVLAHGGSGLWLPAGPGTEAGDWVRAAAEGATRPGPAATGTARAEHSDRLQREAAALRANLLRRKAQTRSRS